MTEYSVGVGGDFATLTAAAKVVQPGDVVHVMTGTYRERLICDVADVTWQAGPGQWPVIDGGWDGTVQTNYAAQVQVPAEGVTVRGLTVRNVAGRGIGVSGSRVKILNNRVDRTYFGGMKIGDSAKAAISNVEVRGNVLTRLSLSFVTEKNATNVDGNFNIHNVRDSVIADNYQSDGWGEAWNIGRGSRNVLLLNNISHSTNHVVGVYFNRCQECEARGNWFYHIPDETYGGKKKDFFSAGCVFGDESGPQVARWPHQRGNRFIGNVVVNTGRLLEVRNNVTNYDTQLLDTVIEGNTFVAGPVTTKGVIIQGNQKGRPHANSVFRRNAVHFTHAKQPADVGSHGQASGIVFEANGWTDAPPVAMRSDSDVRGDLGLVNPGAVIARVGELPHTDFDIENYRPRPESALVTGPVLIGAMDCVDIEEPEEPEPPEPDYKWLVAELEGLAERVAVTGGMLMQVQLKVDELIKKFTEMDG